MWRELAVAHHRRWRSAQFLLSRVCEERSTARRASIEPRVFDRRRDRRISHPIPGQHDMLSFANTLNRGKAEL